MTVEVSALIESKKLADGEKVKSLQVIAVLITPISEKLIQGFKNQWSLE